MRYDHPPYGETIVVSVLRMALLGLQFPWCFWSLVFVFVFPIVWSMVSGLFRLHWSAEWWWTYLTRAICHGPCLTHVPGTGEWPPNNWFFPILSNHLLQDYSDSGMFEQIQPSNQMSSCFRISPAHGWCSVDIFQWHCPIVIIQTPPRLVSVLSPASKVLSDSV